MTSELRAFPAALKMTPLSAEHAGAVVRWRNDPANRAMFLTSQQLSLESQLGWTEKQRRDPLDHTYVALSGATPVGMVAVYGIDVAQRCGEYGRILVDAGWRRRGIGLAISGWIMALGFLSLRLEHMYANCLADNQPIQTLLRSLGFEPARVWRHAGSGRDVTRLEVTVGKWRAAGLDRVHGPSLSAMMAAGGEEAR